MSRLNVLHSTIHDSWWCSNKGGRYRAYTRLFCEALHIFVVLFNNFIYENWIYSDNSYTFKSVYLILIFFYEWSQLSPLLFTSGKLVSKQSETFQHFGGFFSASCIKMSRGTNSILSEIEWDEGLSMPVANADNKALEDKVIACVHYVFEKRGRYFRSSCSFILPIKTSK